MRFLTLTSCMFVVLSMPAQITIDEQATDHGHGHYVREPTECISAVQRQMIITRIAENRSMLQTQGLLNTSAFVPTPLFNWPLRAANGLNDPGYHGISNYVDLNAGYPNQLLDWNCGSRTYDTNTGYNHAGTDIFTWPWSWYKMDNAQVEIIAASPGTIVYKQDGNYDRSCATAGGNWNAVYVMHNDGSVAWYGHMKNGSTTAKAVGQTVAQGEYLGVVGSSGNSTGPHLHFEVYNGANQLIDPWAGACNGTTATSWWATPRPYYDPAVNALRTQSAPTNFGSCPAQEVINERQSFCPSTTIYFTAYYRDQLNGQLSTTTVRRPDNSVFATYTTTASQYYSASWWYNSYTLPSNAPTGKWTYEVLLNGTTSRHYFSVGTQTPLITAASSTSICAGDSVRLTVPRMPGHTYSWKLNGTNITSATDTVLWAKTAGNFSCAATSFCSTNTSSNIAVTILSAPATPLVQQIGVSLYTDPVVGHSYQWYLNGSALAGQSGGALVTTADGPYHVRITAPGGCSSTSLVYPLTTVKVPLKLLLDGPLDPATYLMNDQLRVLSAFPQSDPYPGLGYAHTAVLASASIPSGVLNVIGDNAIVDWVVLELRSALDNAQVVASRSALVQRDGDVVEVDGTSSVRHGVPNGNYFLAVRHRNHLAIMTANALALVTSSAPLDLSSPIVQCYGTAARKAVGSVNALWAGDVDRDGTIKYTGGPNDRDPILFAIGGSVATNTVAGYLRSDVNLDGLAKYTGIGNDRDIILQNIGGSVATNTKVAQIP